MMSLVGAGAADQVHPDLDPGWGVRRCGDARCREPPGSDQSTPARVLLVLGKDGRRGL